MFFSYALEKRETFEWSARFCRTTLVNNLIKEYKIVDAIEVKTPELEAFLRAFLSQIQFINTCANSTCQFENKLQDQLENLKTHANYQEISDSFARCLKDIAEETRDAQTLDRNITNNKIAKIKNQSVYTAILPTIALVVGAVLAVFNPAGLLVLGGAVATVILAESIFWLLKYQSYKALHKKIANQDLEILHTDGLALPFEQLPTAHKKEKQRDNPNTTENEKYYILSPHVDGMVNDAIDASTELVTEVASTAYDAVSSSLYNMWESMRKPSTGQPIASEHLHTL